MWETCQADKYFLEVRDPDGWWGASVRWDGCINLLRYFNAPIQDQTASDQINDNMSDDLHICDIDETIRRLQAIKEMALAHFGPLWPRDIPTEERANDQ